MAFKASSVVPQEAYKIVKGAAVQLKNNLNSINSRLSSADADYEYLRGIYRTLERSRDQFNSLKSTPGLSGYAQDQENDPAYDVVAEFTTMLAAITNALSWLDSNVPTNVTVGAPSTWGDSVLITNTFTPSQTAGLRTQISAVIATID